MRWIATALIITTMVIPPCLAQDDLVPSLGFPDGTAGWSAWTGTTAHEWGVEEGAGPEGEPALWIDARNKSSQVMVMTSSTALKPGARYGFEVWWKMEDAPRDYNADLRIIYRDENEKWIAGVDLYPYRYEQHGEWTRKLYRSHAPQRTAGAAIGIWVRNSIGRFTVARMSIEELPEGQRGFDSMYVYDPNQVELGSAPLLNFRKLKEEGSHFLERADRWNRLMVDVAFVQEELSRARRAADYVGCAPDPVNEHSRTVDGLLADLDALHQTYGRLYDAGNADALPEQFDAPAADLEQRTAKARSALGELIAGLRPAGGEWVAVPEAPTDQPWWDAEAARARYMLWNRWSSSEFFEFEEPLNLGDAFTLTSGTPRFDEQGRPDWSNFMEEWQVKHDAGARRSSLITHYSLHDKGYLSPAFLAAHEDDSDIMMWDAQGQPYPREGNRYRINWLHPGVREDMVANLTSMAEFFRERPEFQFYVTSWESAGPYVARRRIGDNPSHVAAFREWLGARYGTVAEMNAKWGTDYASFDNIEPDPESKAPVGEARSALYIESNRWAQDAYVDYVKLVRDTLHAVDPTKPIVGEHSGLLRHVISPRIYDSVDILGFHRRARHTMPVQVWMASLGRYTGKPTALYENFWGCQEDHPKRISEERVMRAQMRRYAQRHGVWGRVSQTWWYAYTSAGYLLSYNGNWFNPVYDLTTLRYCAAGLPVEKEKLDRLQSLILGSEIAPARLTVVQPYSSMLAQGPGAACVDEWLDWHHLLFPRDLGYEALPDEWFADGTCDLADFDAVILPVATHLDARFIEQLVEFARGGGLVVASGAPGMFDELGHEDGRLLAAAGLTADVTTGEREAWRFDLGAGPGAQGYVEARIGQGRLVLLAAPVLQREDEGEALATLIRSQVTPAAEAPGTTLELLLRRLPDGRHLLCAINRDPDEATEGDVIVQGEFAHAADIDIEPAFPVPTRIDEGRTRLHVQLDAGASVYYLLSK